MADFRIVKAEHHNWILYFVLCKHNSKHQQKAKEKERGLFHWNPVSAVVFFIFSNVLSCCGFLLTASLLQHIVFPIPWPTAYQNEVDRLCRLNLLPKQRRCLAHVEATGLSRH